VQTRSPRSRGVRAHLGQLGSLPWSMIAAEEFHGDVGGLCSRGGWEEMAGSEIFLCFCLSIVAKL
jgi:hypothetical protein